MISPALRKITGTIGTPACIARWNGPFLNAPSLGVHERVPSGAMHSDSPFFNRSTAGLSALIALPESARSRNATSAISMK